MHLLRPILALLTVAALATNVTDIPHPNPDWRFCMARNLCKHLIKLGIKQGSQRCLTRQSYTYCKGNNTEAVFKVAEGQTCVIDPNGGNAIFKNLNSSDPFTGDDSTNAIYLWTGFNVTFGRDYDRSQDRPNEVHCFPSV